MDEKIEAGQGESVKCLTTVNEQLTSHSEEILYLRNTLDIAFANGARSSSAPEDRIIFPLGVACRDLMEEVLFAVSDGFGRSALRSVRTMYECVVFTRYLSAHPDKTDDYLATFHRQWATVLKHMPNADKEMPEVHKEVSRMVPAYAAQKYVSLDWSDKSTVDMAKEVGIPSHFHAAAFNYTSAFVHPSAVFMIRHLSRGMGNIVEISADSQEEEAKSALRLSHCLILNAIGLRLQYAPSTPLQDGLKQCEKHFQAIWGYPNPI